MSTEVKDTPVEAVQPKAEESSEDFKLGVDFLDNSVAKVDSGVRKISSALRSVTGTNKE